MQTQTEIVTLANIEEWFCDLATTGNDPKFAMAAQTIHMAREALATSTDLPLDFDNAIIGELILSPTALARRDGPGIPIKPRRNPWLDGLNWLFRR